MRALILIAALAAGASYYASHRFPAPPPWSWAWKGSGVALLALWAWASGSRWIAGVLAFGALGDMLLDAVSLEAGAASFLIGHFLAAMFYAKHARKPGAPWLVSGTMVAVAGPVVAAFPNGWTGILVYSAGLGLMAELALRSRFRLAGAGAVLFVISDLLIFARMGMLAGSSLPGVLIWPTYFAGQALIAIGVAGERSREDLHHRL